MYLQSISFDSAFNGRLAAIFKGPEDHVRVVKKNGTQLFCNIGKLNDQEKQKLENEHKIPTKIHLDMDYSFPAPYLGNCSICGI